MARFNGKITEYKNYTNENIQYNQATVNKWHVILLIHKRMDLIKYRKHNIKKIEKIEKLKIFQRIKTCGSKCLCCKKHPEEKYEDGTVKV